MLGSCSVLLEGVLQLLNECLLEELHVRLWDSLVCQILVQLLRIHPVGRALVDQLALLVRVVRVRYDSNVGLLELLLSQDRVGGVRSDLLRLEVLDDLLGDLSQHFPG